MNVLGLFLCEQMMPPEGDTIFCVKEVDGKAIKIINLSGKCMCRSEQCIRMHQV